MKTPYFIIFQYRLKYLQCNYIQTYSFHQHLLFLFQKKNFLNLIFLLNDIGNCSDLM